VAAAPQAPPYGPKATRLTTPRPWTQPGSGIVLASLVSIADLASEPSVMRAPKVQNY